MKLACLLNFAKILSFTICCFVPLFTEKYKPRGGIIVPETGIAAAEKSKDGTVTYLEQIMISLSSIFENDSHIGASQI